MINEQDFDAWKDSPVTEALMEFAQKKREARRTDWEDGTYNEPTFEATLQKQATALGYCSAYREIQELTFDQLESELKDE